MQHQHNNNLDFNPDAKFEISAFFVLFVEVLESWRLRVTEDDDVVSADNVDHSLLVAMTLPATQNEFHITNI